MRNGHAIRLAGFGGRIRIRKIISSRAEKWWGSGLRFGSVKGEPSSNRTARSPVYVGLRRTMFGYIAKNLHSLDGYSRSVFADVGEGNATTLDSGFWPVAIATGTAINNAARQVAQLVEDEREENVVFEPETAAGVEDYKLWLRSKYMPRNDACDGMEGATTRTNETAEMSPVAKENVSLKNALQKSTTTCRRLVSALHDCNAKVKQKDGQIIVEQRQVEEANKKHIEASTKCNTLQNQIEDVKKEASDVALSLNNRIQELVGEVDRKMEEATKEVKSLKTDREKLLRFNLKARDQVHRSQVQLLKAKEQMDMQTEEASRQAVEMNRKIELASLEVKSLKADNEKLQCFKLKARDQVLRANNEVKSLKKILQQANLRVQDQNWSLFLETAERAFYATARKQMWHLFHVVIFVYAPLVAQLIFEGLQPARCAASLTLAQSKFTKVERQKANNQK
ncbi:hypothetical protein THAOC_08548, partial [Thalassiosira oceanica]